MAFETWFSIAGVLAMLGWLAILASPLVPKWSDWVAGIIVPLTLSLGYIALALLPASSHGGGFGTLAEVSELFSHEQAALAGWVHFLAFDLFIGAWMCRKARREGIAFWLVLPCLPLTFLFGPTGLVAFWVMRFVRGRWFNKT